MVMKKGINCNFSFKEAVFKCTGSYIGNIDTWSHQGVCVGQVFRF